MDLKVPISIADELTEEVITSNGLLNLASGEIGRIEYEDYDIDTQGLPFESEDYEFTCGTLSNNGKDVEFRIEVNTVTGQYSVSASELLEIKVRAAALFAGVSGPALAVQASARAQAALGTAPPANTKPANAAPANTAPAAEPKPRGGRGGRYH